MATIILGCLCCLFLFATSGIPLIGWILFHLFSSIHYANSYTEGLIDFLFYLYSWIIYLIPHCLVLGICYKFYLYIFKKNDYLKKMKHEMLEEKDSPILNFYVERMKIMKETLFYIFGFLIALRFSTWMFFQNSFIMEIVAYTNVGILMALLLTEESQLNQKWFIYNCALIFVSSLIIDDSFQMLTGYKFLFL